MNKPTAPKRKAAYYEHSSQYKIKVDITWQRLYTLSEYVNPGSSNNENRFKISTPYATPKI
jgi:hypothetical protein